MFKKAVFLAGCFSALILGFAILDGCQGTPDRSLTVDAYPPLDQAEGKANAVLPSLQKIRFGAFEEVSGDYRSVYIQEYPEFDGESVELPELPSSETVPYTYVIEGFGGISIESTIYCETTVADACGDGWQCKRNTDNLNVCTRAKVDALIARGISSPFTYSGNDKASVDVLFSRTINFGIMTTPDGNAAALNIPRYGHQALLLPNGKVLLFGGEAKFGASQPTFPTAGELFDPSTSAFTSIEIKGWSGGRSFFAAFPITQAEAAPTDEAAAETEVTEFEFIIIGGKTELGPTNEIYIGTYSLETEAVSFQELNTGSSITPVVYHTVTDLGGNKFLIAGGQTTSGAPISDVWLLDYAASSLSPVGQGLSRARFMHTATLMPNGNVVFVGGRTDEGVTAIEDGYTTFMVEVYSAETGAISTYDYKTAGEDDTWSPSTSRAGHIAIPVANYRSDGTVAEDDWANARVAIYGGYRFEKNEADSGVKFYYNMPTGSENVKFPFVTSDGKVDAPAEWSVSGDDYRGYNEAMTRAKIPSPHPAVEAVWTWMGPGKSAVLVFGGRQNDKEEKGYSNWAEVLRFEGGEFGFDRSSFKFGPDDQDSIRTPFRIAQTSVGRWAPSITRLDNGMFLIAGGKTYRNSAAQTLNSAEILNPPSYNRLGNVFKVVTDF